MLNYNMNVKMNVKEATEKNVLNNTERQRIWRLKNLERSRELKRRSNWKSRGEPQLKKSKAEVTRRWREKQIPTKEILDSIKVELCAGCLRRYLPKLGCLWCLNRKI